MTDWHINRITNFDHVICEYIYRVYPQQERRPLSRNFSSGEFAKLCKKSLEVVDLIFREGIDFKIEAIAENPSTSAAS
ncbi:MAG TPA: hypothetical protein DCE56_27925, partial [Cyanobacteria bacterium UBA8553]|nr:hypothetical protein [Cyanobacteria bacterium UBA8553]